MSMDCGVIGLHHDLGRRDRARCASMSNCGVANVPGDSVCHALLEPAPRPVFCVRVAGTDSPPAEQQVPSYNHDQGA